MRIVDVPIFARDGYKLAGTLYEPETANGVSVLVSSATTVQRPFYAKFARHLCAMGFVVATYDFRGIGDSSNRSWRGRPASFRAWGEEDLAGAIDTLADRFPRHRLVCISHSIGGVLFGLANNNHRVAAQLAISAPSSYWRNADHAPSRRRLWLLCMLVFPLLSRLYGRLPGWVTGSGDWPKGVALEWARWSRDPNYVIDDDGKPLREHFEQYRGKMRFYILADDFYYAPPRAVEQTAAFFRRAEVEIVRRGPQDYGVEAIGHFGFFRSFMPTRAWDELAEWTAKAASAAGDVRHSKSVAAEIGGSKPQ
jgi:predicted alpha/beta hydrolase